MEQIKPIEGITPGMIWTFVAVLVGLAALYVLYGKVRETYAKNKHMKDPGNKLADEISARVLEKLEPRFAEIDKKLANDKATLDGHTRQIEALATRTDGNEDGVKALSRGVLALLNHTLHNGNTDELEHAQQALNDYLIEK
jgi:uncharacterized protein HemX